MIKQILSIITYYVIGAFVVPVMVFGGEANATQPTTESKVVQTTSVDGKIKASVAEAKIKGDVLTLKFMVKNVSDDKTEGSIYLKEVSYQDIEKMKEYFCLKSKSGCIGGPNRSFFSMDLAPGKQAMFWIKFPAPRETADTIDIYIPGFFPMEEVPLTR